MILSKVVLTSLKEVVIKLLLAKANLDPEDVNNYEAVARLNQYQSMVMDWMRVNKLKLNPDKMEVLLVGGSSVQLGKVQPVLDGKSPQERRGSNVSLTLDMSSLGSIEPFVAVPTPREKVAMEYLQSASRILTRQQLKETVASSHLLQTEFMEIPMNFVDPKEIDIPSHGTKNRYKTILPNPVSRVCLKPKNPGDALSTYINANYIKGYGGQEKAFIATQGPMINTVNDFWLMVWQEDSPVIVMITKLKEKNEKCVLYWPEKRGIYGKVEVLVNSVQECKNYTIRNLTLKQGTQSRQVKHYWYTSWPDHKTPDSAQPLLQLMLDVEEDRVASVGRGPVIVHCSAGIGRTGCFIATAIGCYQLKKEGVVDALSIVCQLRLDRGGMVQTSEQYEFVHHALTLYESRLSAEAVQ
ncbi:Receptor-type tyrosine-protein phosphatase R [Varanus komodoensis]|nr:Receptor-type tyrosine-protein phosphatase R [Varanus komodoensis]